jgi:DNA-binding SARP family transcriptional activator
LNLKIYHDDDSLTDMLAEYEKSIELSRTLEVPRLLVEADWGLCRAYGYRGDFQSAQRHAQEAIEIASEAGDEWIASLTRVTMGASLMLSARYEAAETWLNRAVLGFGECSDTFGRSLAQLWMAYGYFKQKDTDRVAQILPGVLAACRQHGYYFIFTRPTLLGPFDERRFVPLLLHARENGWESGYVDRLLEILGLRKIQIHPGFRLRIQTLGCFRVWRGSDMIAVNGWRRESARLLFQIFLTYRRSPLDRDQICEFLWPGAEQVAAHRNFKIALNTLYQVLEPEREPGSESAFIFRDGTTYTLRPNADIWLDVEEFEDLVRQAGKSDPVYLQKALDLCRGDYLLEALYEPWAAEERERLASLFLESADRLTESYIARGQYPQAIDLSQRVLQHDRCWERAYRHLMLAYDRLGDRGQVGRTYQRCAQALREELEISPSPETQELYERLVTAL